MAFSGGTTGFTYTTQLGSYIKIGKLVNIWIHIVVANNGSSTGAATISGLPFTSATQSVAFACAGDGITATTNFVAHYGCRNNGHRPIEGR